MGSYSCEKGHQCLQEPWILAFSKSVETFVMVSISDIPNIKYSQNLGTLLDTAKEKITKQCRIVDTSFTSLATIGANLFSGHPMNLNNVRKDSNSVLSVVIILGTYVCGDEKVFKME